MLEARFVKEKSMWHTTMKRSAGLLRNAWYRLRGFPAAEFDAFRQVHEEIKRRPGYAQGIEQRAPLTDAQPGAAP